MPMPGGSGGYIYITTFNKLGQNELDPDSIIQARGGYGQGGAAGGSGGVIVVDGGFDMLEELIDT